MQYHADEIIKHLVDYIADYEGDCIISDNDLREILLKTGFPGWIYMNILVIISSSIVLGFIGGIVFMKLLALKKIYMER